MNFDFSDEQRMLADHARQFLSETCTHERLRTHISSGAEYDAELWQQMIELGWPALSIPEDCGGLGMGALELCVLAEEVGRTVAPTPFFSTVCLGAEVLKRADVAAATELLGKIAGGEAIVAVDLQSTGLSLQGTAVSGTLKAVAYGTCANYLIACADGAVVLVDTAAAGVETARLKPGMDEVISFSSIILDNAPAVILASGDAATALVETVLNQAAVLTAFEQVGGTEVSIYMARDYTLERYCFGRQIGGYQAVKHRLATMLIKLELARSNAYYGAWAMETGAAELPFAAAVARISATEAYEFAAEESLQLHGGIGYTWEANCHFYYKRARLLAMNLGNTAFWSERLLSARH